MIDLGGKFAMPGLYGLHVHPAYGDMIKGSLEVGKLADLVILDKNPLTADPKTIKDIKVVETIKDGKSIYKAK